MWSFIFTRTFRKRFLSVEPAARRKIEAFIVEHQKGIEDLALLNNFSQLTNSPGFARLRFGKYRVGVFLDYEAHIMEFRFVGARGDFYKHFPRR